MVVLFFYKHAGEVGRWEMAISRCITGKRIREGTQIYFLGYLNISIVYGIMWLRNLSKTFLQYNLISMFCSP